MKRMDCASEDWARALGTPDRSPISEDAAIRATLRHAFVMIVRLFIGACLMFKVYADLLGRGWHNARRH